MLKQDSELELSLPKCLAEYLVLFFYELGICEQGINGITPLSWTEIESWKNSTRRDLSPWEIGVLRDMSRAYVNEYHAGTDKNRPQPYFDSSEVEMTDVRRNNVASAWKAQKEAFKQMKNKE